MFKLDNEAADYALHISGFNGDAGDSMMYTGLFGICNQNGMSFSTTDRDNDNLFLLSCAQTYGNGGWWYNNCDEALLNTDNSGDFQWGTLSTSFGNVNLNAARMMIKLA